MKSDTVSTVSPSICHEVMYVYLFSRLIGHCWSGSDEVGEEKDSGLCSCRDLG